MLVVLVAYSDCFFFASRRRHTRCALVTGVQTCALPISAMIRIKPFSVTTDASGDGSQSQPILGPILRIDTDATAADTAGCDVTWTRSEERRVGKECVSTCRSRWSPYH